MYTVIITIIGALLGVYFRESLRIASRQKSVVARLNAYIAYYRTTILEIDGLFEIMHIGTQWHSEYLELVSKKNVDYEEVMALNNKYEETLKTLKEAIASGEKNDDFLKSIDAVDKVKLFNNEILETLKTTRQNIVDSNTFVSDDDASILGEYLSGKIIEMKMRLLSLIDTSYTLILEISKKANFKPEEHADSIYRLIRAAIVFSRCMESTSHSIKRIQTSSVLTLTSQVMIGGK